jgi:hypothetical protein
MNLRPEKSEYAAFYETYVSLVNETDVVSALDNQTNELRDLLAAVDAEKENFRYAEGKWSVKELLGHIIDAERVFSYRALRISRGDQTPLAGFEENAYVAGSNFGNTKPADLIEEFALLRAANVLLFKNLSENAWNQIGTASEAAVSVRALAFIMVGHVRHHANILRQRYLTENEV